MNEPLTLDLPEDLARRARALAAATNRRLEDVVIDSVARAVAEPAVETLADDQLLALCDTTLTPADQDDLSRLLAARREAPLDAAGGLRLDELMTSYRRGLVLKARAVKEAVSRGLRPPLSEDAA
jgi:hypothetical protein